MSRIVLGWKIYKINNFSRWPCKNRKIYEIYKINILHPGLNSDGKLTQLTIFHEGLAKLAILLFRHRSTIPSFISSSIFADNYACKVLWFLLFSEFWQFSLFHHRPSITTFEFPCWFSLLGLQNCVILLYFLHQPSYFCLFHGWVQYWTYFFEALDSFKYL